MHAHLPYALATHAFVDVLHMLSSAKSGKCWLILNNAIMDLAGIAAVRNAHVSLLAEGWASREQIRDCFNESVLESLMDATVVCAGTTMGGRDAIMAYLQLMSDIAHFLAKESCFVTFGVDQGFHNFIVHYLKPKRPELLRFEALQIANDDSPIYTVGMIDTENRVKFTGDTFLLLNGKGVRPPVVHQVDRKDDFQAYSDHFALGRIWRLQ